MGFDISQIQNAALKKLAEKVDKKNHKDGYLDNSEFSIFSTKSEKITKKDMSAKTEFSAISAFFGTNDTVGDELTISATNPMQLTSGTKTLSKKERKKVEDEVSNAVKEFAKKGKDIEGIMEALTKKFGARYTQADLAERDESGNIKRDENHRIILKDGDEEVGDYKLDASGKIQISPEYAGAVAEVEALFNAMKAANGNKKQVKEAYGDDWSGFQKNLFKHLNNVSENTEASAVYKTKVLPLYEAKIAEAQKFIEKDPSYVPNYEQFVKDIKESLKSNKEEWEKSEVREAVEKLEERAKKDAYNRAVDLLPTMNGESKGEIRSNMRDLSQDGYFRHAIQDLKTDRKVYARHNAVENKNTSGANSDVRHDDLKSDLKKKVNLGLFKIKTGGGETLTEKLDVYKTGTDENGDNVYDLVALSDDIISRVGFDYMLNRNDDDLEMSEIKNLKEHLEYKTGKEFTDNEIKRLCKYCKVEIEHRDRSFKSIMNRIFLGIPSAVSGAVGGFLAKHGDLEITNIVKLDLTQKQAQSVITQLDEAGVEYTKQTNGQNIHIDILQQVVKNDRQMNAIMGAIVGAGIGSIPTLALLAFGGDKNEKSCVSVSDYSIKEKKYTDLESYKRYVDQRYGQNQVKAEAMKNLAELCKKQADKMDGVEWHEIYNDMIREMAGYGSKLNPEECIGFKYFSEKPEEVVPPTPPTPPTQPCEECDAYVQMDNFTHTRKGGDTWAGIVSAYYPCLVEEKGLYGANGAIRALKKALSYDENGNFNKDTYRKLLRGGDLPKTMILPKQIEGCERIDDATVKTEPVIGSGKALVQKVGSGDYVAIDGCENSIKARGRNKAEAVKNLEEKTNKKYKDVIDE